MLEASDSVGIAFNAIVLVVHDTDVFLGVDGP